MQKMRHELGKNAAFTELRLHSFHRVPLIRRGDRFLTYLHVIMIWEKEERIDHGCLPLEL